MKQLMLYIFMLFFGVNTASYAETTEEKLNITVYKSPTCGCCSKWVDHLTENDFEVQTHDTQNMDKVKQMAGITPELSSCHTAMIDGYVVEGHVPAADIKRLLKERPDIKGLTAAGMPMGSPGMEMPDGRKDEYQVLSIGKDGKTSVFAEHGGENE